MKEFETRVQKEAKRLLNKKEKILVACSGGKDSTTILYLLHKWGYNVEGVIIDLQMGPWFKQNVDNVNHFCKEKGIKLHTVDVRKIIGGGMCYIRSCIQNKVKLNNCLICGVVKRYLLNKEAKKQKASVLVTGHNRDDLAEALIMNLIMSQPKQSMGLGNRNGVIEDDSFIQRVKPLNYIAEDEIREYSKKMNFPVVYEPCPCSHNAFRRDVKKLIQEFKINQDNIIKFHQILEPKIETKYKKTGTLKHCNECGEATRGEKCNACKLISLI